MNFYKYIWWWPQVYNEFKEYEKKKTIIIVNMMTLRPKLDLASCFWALHMMMSSKHGGGGSLHSQVEHHVQDKFAILYGIDTFKFYDIFPTYT